jgi:hypothetical protein
MAVNFAKLPEAGTVEGGIGWGRTTRYWAH